MATFQAAGIDKSATMIDADASDLAKYNVILGMHRADKWSGLPEPVVNVPFTDVQTGKRDCLVLEGRACFICKK